MDLVVRQLTKPLVHVHPETPLGVCARLLMQNGFRHLPVVDDMGRPVGIVGDLNVYSHGALLGPNLELWLAFDPASDRLRAGDVQRPFAGRATPGTSLLVALHTLANGDGDAIAVVDADDRLVGLLTEHDAVVAARDLVDPARRVSEFATEPAECVDWLTSGHEALQRMVGGGIRHLPVLRDGDLYGVISVRDLVAENVAQRRELTVHDAMRPGPVHSATPTESLRAAAARMAAERVGSLPVVDDRNNPIGILTRRDLLEAAVDALDQGGLFQTEARSAREA